MKHFTIDAENNITLHASAKQAQATANAERFSNSAALAKLAEKWPASRLVEIWNSLPGAAPVKKFKDRQTPVTRIWNAIQSLAKVASAPEPAVAEPPTTLSPESIEQAIPADFQPAPQNGIVESAAEPPATEEPTSPTAPAATKKATRARKAPTAEPKPKVARECSKTDQAVAMMKRPGGATLPELMATFGWQAHTVRGFVAGALTKKLGLTVTSTKPEGGQRTYTIAS